MQKPFHFSLQFFIDYKIAQCFSSFLMLHLPNAKIQKQNSSPFSFNYNSKSCEIETVPIEVNNLNALLIDVKLIMSSHEISLPFDSQFMF